METQVQPDAAHAQALSRMMTFFMIMYLVEGWAQQTGIIHLPLFMYFDEVLGLKEDKAGALMFVLGWPWMVKPLYGLFSDAVPLFGYRRKSYLFLLNVLAAVAFGALIFLADAWSIVAALFVITVAMAASSSLCGGLLVECGRNTDGNTKLCSQQTLFANVANISAATIGGWLIAYFSARSALHVAAFVTLFAPLLVVLATLRYVDEPRSEGGIQFSQVKGGVKTAVMSPVLWLLAGFLVLWAFNPGFGYPLIVYMKDELHWSKGFIGELAAWFAGGAAAGAILFRWLSPKVSMNLAVVLLVIVGASVQYSFVYMHTAPVAIVLNVLNGALTASAGLAVHVVAANKCPKGAEGFVYGLLISLTNASYSLSQWLGGIIYVDYLKRDINALIVISAALTLACLIVVPFLNFAKEESPTWYQRLRQRFGGV
jgi:predicted MFS family arabinose efflux permease